MHPIIALWSHPRSMSTAMERVMRERGDLQCHHEPFMYDYYINRQVRVMPHFEAVKGHPTTYTQVRDMLLTQSEIGPVFLKDMSYYVMPRILEDSEFADRLTNCFLIRNPLASIPSYYKLDPEVTLEEIGLESQAHHYNALVAAGKNPTILQAEDIRADTRKAVGSLWKAIGLEHKEQAFDWQNESPKEWEQVGGWHGDVSTSSGIRPITEQELSAQKQKFEKLVQKVPEMQAYYDHHIPFYEKLRANAIRL